MARRRPKLAGDQLATAVSGPDLLSQRERSGGLDPVSMAEFLAYDIPFRTEPATNVIFPPEAQPEARDD